MITSILSIIAAILPFILDLLDPKRTNYYADKQKLRKAIFDGDIDTIADELDRLREENDRIKRGQ